MDSLPSGKPLAEHFGHPVKWWLTADGEQLKLTGHKEQPPLVVTLGAKDTQALRAMAGAAATYSVTVEFPQGPVTLLLVGRKVDQNLWSGTALDAADTPGAVTELHYELSFMERVLEEMDSLFVVILDRYCNIKRFNRRCENLSHMREADVIGKNALDLFMPPEQAEIVRNNISEFFATQTTWSPERTVYTKEGPRLVHWHNRLVKHGKEDQWFLLCVGRDITPTEPN